MKSKELNREEHITGLSEFTIMEGWLTERYTSIKPFGFLMAAISSTQSNNTVNTWLMNVLKRILTPSFTTVDIFALVVP